MVENDEYFVEDVKDLIYENDPDDLEVDTNRIWGPTYGSIAAASLKRPFKPGSTYSTYLVDNNAYSLFLSYFIAGRTNTDEANVRAEIDENGLPVWQSMVILGPSPESVTKDELAQLTAAENGGAEEGTEDIDEEEEEEEEFEIRGIYEDESSSGGWKIKL